MICKRKESNPINLEDLPTIDILREYGGLISGHIAFRTQEHGNGYVEKMHFLKYPEVMNLMGKRIADVFQDKRNEIDLVVGPVHMGVVLAYAVAFHLHKPFTLTYKEMRSGEGIVTGSSHFHRSAAPEKGQNVLFVDDFVSTGNDMRRNLVFFESLGVPIAGVGLIGMREIDTTDLNTDIRVLEKIDYWKVPEDACSLCKENAPFVATDIRE